MIRLRHLYSKTTRLFISHGYTQQISTRAFKELASDDFQKAKRYFEKHKSPQYYNSMIEECASRNDLNSCYDLILENNMTSMENYTRVVQALFRESKFEQGRILYEKMCQEGHTPHSDVFNTMIQSYAKSKRVHDILTTFNSIGKRHKIIPSQYTFNTMIEALGQCGQVQMCQSMFDGVPMRDQVTYYVMIKWMCILGEVQKATQVYNMLLDTEYEPDEVTNLYMIHLYTTCGLPKQAEQLLSRLSAPTLATITSVINAYVKHGDLAHAQELFDAVPRKDIALYNTMINGYTLQKTMKGMIHATNWMEHAKQHGIEPDRITYETLARGWSLIGLNSKALQVVKTMKQLGMGVQVSVYNLILATYLKENQLSKALELLHQMVHEHVVDTVTYNTLIHYHLSRNEFEMAQQTIHDMKVKPDASTYNILIKCYVKNNMMKLAEAMYQEMKGKGIVPDEHTYRTLLGGYFESHQFDKGNVLKEVAQKALPNLIF